MIQQQNKPLRIGIVVGEVSGDTLGVALMRSFKAQGINAVFEGAVSQVGTQRRRQNAKRWDR